MPKMSEKCNWNNEKIEKNIFLKLRQSFYWNELKMFMSSQMVTFPGNFHEMGEFIYLRSSYPDSKKFME
jgi:hypothetical protein